MSERFDRSALSHGLAERRRNAISGLSCRLGMTLIAVAVWLLPGHNAFAQSLAPVWVLSTIAGNGTNADKGDGGPAASAEIGKPYEAVMDRAGNLYVSEATDVVRKISSSGVITTVAGTSGKAGYSGDGGPATSALLNAPYGLAIDNNGNLLIADEGNEVIRKVNAVTGIITTIAGTGKSSGYSGDGGPATSALLHTPYGVGADHFGNIYIADYANHVIRKVDTSGTITTFAGTGTSGVSGDGGAAALAELSGPFGIWADAAGNVYVADYGGEDIRMIDTGGTIHTFAGNATAGFSGDGGSAASAELAGPRYNIGDGLGNFYIADENNHVIRGIDSSGDIGTIAGTPGAKGFLGDGGPATEGELDYPYGLAIDSDNNLYIPDASNYRVRRLSLNTGLPSTAVGAESTQNLFVESSAVVTPNMAAVTPSAPAEFRLGVLSGCSLGVQLAASTPCEVPISFQPAAPGLRAAQLAFTDAGGSVSTIGLYGIGVAPQVDFSLAAIDTIAGNGTAGNSATEVSAPRGGTIDSAGNIYFADSGNNVIRKIDVSGAITVVAGTGQAGYAGDGAAATSAQLNAPAKVVVDAAGDLYIADTGNNVIRYVSAATGYISTIAGTGTAGYTGDGGAATAAELNGPQGLAVDQGGHVYVADTGNNAIRYFGNGGLIGTLAGTGTAGYSGDGGNAYSAELNAPEAVDLDQNGDVYVADTGNDVIRLISSTNQISTFAGQQATAVNAGDGGAAAAASLDQPSDIALDAAGDVYIAAGGQVRMVNTSGIIGTLAGTGAAGSYSGEGGAATSAVLPAPVSNLMLDSSGDIMLADTAANRVLKVASAAPMSLNMGVQAPGTTGPATTFSVLNAGNAALNIGGVAATAGFTLQTGGTSDCTVTTSLAPGQSCTIGIAFTPDSGTNGAVSGTLTLTDNALNGTGATQTFTLSGSTKVVYNTTTTVTTSPASPVYGAAATITATVTNGSSPTGTVSFTVNGNPIGSSSLNSNQATIALPSLPAGTISIAAAYSGDANNNSSSGSESVIIQPAVLTVTAANASMSQGASLPPFTYTITGFVNGDSSSVVTGAPAETTTATSSSPQGTYPIVLSLGTLAAANYTFTFVDGTLTIGPPPTPDFTLTVTPTAATTPANTPYIATLTLTPLYGYNGTVKVSCTSNPQGLGCSALEPFTSSQGGSSWAQIRISPAGNSLSASAAQSAPANQTKPWLAIGLPFCFLGLFFCRDPKNKSYGWLRCLILLTMLTLTAGVTACSKSAKVAAIGTYQVVITAADAGSNLSHSTTLTLTLQ